MDKYLIEHIFLTVKKVLIEYLKEDENNFVGLTESEIKDLENVYNIEFPVAYKIFLSTFAGKHLKIFDHQSYNTQGIEKAQGVSKEILKADNKILPDTAFVFSQWQGYQFYYWAANQTDNPYVFLYIEGGGSEKVPPEIYYQGTFTNWLINLSVNYMQLVKEKYDTNQIKKGIEELKTLIKPEK